MQRSGCQVLIGSASLVILLYHGIIILSRVCDATHPYAASPMQGKKGQTILPLVLVALVEAA